MEDLAGALAHVAGIIAFFALVIWIVCCEGILDLLSAAMRGAL